MGRVNKKNAGGRPEKLERIPAFLAALVGASDDRHRG